jgi:hypothetical protein
VVKASEREGFSGIREKLKFKDILGIIIGKFYIFFGQIFLINLAFYNLHSSLVVVFSYCTGQ